MKKSYHTKLFSTLRSTNLNCNIISYYVYFAQSVQYFLKNVLIDVQTLIYGISIAFKCESNAHF